MRVARSMAEAMIQRSESLEALEDSPDLATTMSRLARPIGGHAPVKHARHSLHVSALA